MNRDTAWPYPSAELRKQWEEQGRRRRAAQLADVLRIPIDAVSAWQNDWQREAIAKAEWGRIIDAHIPAQDTVGRRAVGCCQRYRLSLADVQQATDRALLALDGMGPKSVSALRAIPQTGEQSLTRPRPPLPHWVMEE